MNYDSSHRRAAPANPVVIITAGELGARVFELLRLVAEDLNLRYRGQYGLAQITSRKVKGASPEDDEPELSSRYELATSIFSSINDPHDVPLQQLWSGTVGPADDRGRREAANLLRRICPLASDRAELRVAPETSYEVYLLIDLSDQAAVIGALRFAQSISKETTHYEMTAILLTGRSSQPEQKDSESWRAGLAAIVAAHDKENKNFGCLFHRAYLLDGVNSRRAWLDSPESLCTLAARFLLQHGFSADRRWLRMHEQARVTERQEFREVLGSFAIRHVTCGIECIAEEVTDVLLGDALFSNANPREDDSVASAAVEEFEKKVEALAHDNHSLEDVARIRETVLNQIGKAVNAVTRKNQVSRILRLFEKLAVAIPRLHARVQVQERMRERRRVADGLRRQVHGVDARGELRKPIPDIQSYSPKEYVRFPLAVSKKKLILGLVVLVLGAVAGCFTHENVRWPLTAGLAGIFIGALVVDMPASPWALDQIYRTWVGRKHISTEEKEVLRYRNPAKIPRVIARDLPSAGFVVGGILLASLGVALAIYSLRLENLAIEPAEFWCVGTFSALAAVLALYQPRNQPGRLTKPPTPRGTAAEDLLSDGPPEGPCVRSVSEYPLAYFPGTFGLWRYFWLTLLTSCVAWAILNWEVNLRNTPYPWPVRLSHEYAPWAVRLGVIFLGAAAALLIWPHKGAYTCGRMEPTPEMEPADITASFSVSKEVDICLLDTLDWLHELWNNPEEDTDSTGTEQTFLDVIDAEWQEKLAAACRPYLQARGELANDWAEFIKAEIARGPTRLNRHNLARMFTLRCVQRWLNSVLKEQDWSHLMELLRPQATWMGRYFERELAPMWPVGSAPLMLDTGAAMVDSRLQMAVTAQELAQQTTWRFRGVQWPENGDKRGLVVLVRMVQGLAPNELMNLLPNTGE